MSDDIFFHFDENPPFSIWDAYLTTIREEWQARKNIHHAYVCQDLANYPVQNDTWVGEQLYQRLPIAKKLTLAPKFLKYPPGII